MGLAGPSNKVKIGLDPRNTAWANDTNRFGHQQLLKMGWKPGKGLGYTNIGATSHIKVKVKRDNVGLGKENAMDDQPHGLDVFQQLLGRLNGTEDKVSRQLAEKQRQAGVYLNFVSGGVLEGTIDEYLERKANSVDSKADKKLLKKLSKESKEKSKKHKEKKDKKEKKEKKEKKKDKKDKKKPKALNKPVEEKVTKASTPSAPLRGIRATRSRYIAMKKQATSDDKGLQEILMSMM